MSELKTDKNMVLNIVKTDTCIQWHRFDFDISGDIKAAFIIDV